MSVIGDILAGSYDEYDQLPVSAKLLLGTRLLNSIATDISGFRDRFFHDAGNTVVMPRLTQQYGDHAQQAVGDYHIDERRGGLGA
jgi:hypothetical protein